MMKNTAQKKAQEPTKLSKEERCLLMKELAESVIESIEVLNKQLASPTIIKDVQFATGYFYGTYIDIARLQVALDDARRELRSVFHAEPPF